MSPTPTLCPACNRENTSEFCPECGENQHPKRFSIGTVIGDVPNAIVNFERGLPYTIRELALRPGKTVRGYLAGARSRHYRPLNFVFLVGGLYTLFFSLANIQGVMGTDATSGMTEWELFIQEQSIQYQAFLLLMQLPFFALVSWLLFRKRGFYYGEHLVGNAFMVAEITLYQLLMFPLYSVFNHTAVVDVLNIIYLFFMMGYGIYMYYDWFYQRRGFGEAWRCVLAVVLNIILVVITVDPLMILIFRINAALFGAG